MEQLKTIGRELSMGTQGGWSLSKEFLDLVKSIGEARSKAEEERIVLREIETLKRRISYPDVSKRKMKEYIIRLVYVEMLGHDASFGYIHAVKMTHDDSLILKRTGYLAVTLFLNEDHDLIILIVNTIQKDLKSDNYLVVCAALAAVCRLINEETIPAVLPQVVELLGHPREAVRKKAVMALHRFYRRAPGSLAHLLSSFRKRLCDNDPGVMGAALYPLYDLIRLDTHSYKDLVISFVNILKQVAERRLPKGYDYHQMPAPFVQIRLLKILALLGSEDKQASEHMYAVLADIFRKAEPTNNIGNAVLYECICCVSSIFPSSKLLNSAVGVTSKFLRSESHNLKYLGIDALGRLIKASPDIAEEQQLAVIDCLEDPDDTLKRKTFELLFKMTKSSNVEVIVDRMISYMTSVSDNHYKADVASRCIELAEQFAPSHQWFIEAMNRVFELAADLINPKVIHNLMRLIAEGFGEENDNDGSQLRSSAVESYLKIVGEPKLPSLFVQVICWVLGEYGTVYGKYSASYITGRLCDVVEAYVNDDTVKAYAVTAMMKIFSFEIAAERKMELLPECHSFINGLLASHSTDLQQRAYELQAVLGLDSPTVGSILPVNSSCAEFQVDKDLAFLNSFVHESLEKGARSFVPKDQRGGLVTVSHISSHERLETTSSLRFEAYELPKLSPEQATSIAASEGNYMDPVGFHDSTLSTSFDQVTMPDFGVRLKLDGVQKKWGKPTWSSSPSVPATSTQDVSGTNLDKLESMIPLKESVDSAKQHTEVSYEKQKLAASLFGAPSSRSEQGKSLSSHRSSTGNTIEHKVHSDKRSFGEAALVPLPDLLDLGEPTSGGPALIDPFQQLEGLLAPAGVVSPGNSVNPRTSSDLANLFGALSSVSEPHPASGDFFSAATGVDGQVPDINNIGNSIGTSKKGLNSHESIGKDANTELVGVMPSQTNPDLFKDLLS